MAFDGDTALMNKLQRSDLYSLEQYAEKRDEFRRELMTHKAQRRVDLDDHISLFFEDRLTMQYQVQEILRTEKIFEADGIQEELDAYNPLIPDGSNLKATLMIQYEDIDERKQALARLIGIETAVWISIAGGDKVFAHADEDLERETEEKTSSVHFLRYEFTPEMVSGARNGGAIAIGIDHTELMLSGRELDAATRAALAADFS